MLDHRFNVAVAATNAPPDYRYISEVRMEQLIKKMTQDDKWKGWVAANSGGTAKDGCISAAPKSGCISVAKAGCIS